MRIERLEELLDERLLDVALVFVLSQELDELAHLKSRTRAREERDRVADERLPVVALKRIQNLVEQAAGKFLDNVGIDALDSVSGGVSGGGSMPRRWLSQQTNVAAMPLR